jgi:hypothetical protein
MYIMTLSKKTIALCVSFLALLFLCLPGNIKAQDKARIRLSGGAALGYAPEVTLGNNANNGLISTFFAELEYGKAFGRLHFSQPWLSTFRDNDNLNGGQSYHGSLGYRASFSRPFSIAFLLSGGATLTRYSNGINGSTGSTFTNVSPQVGVNLLPIYQLTELFSIQGSIRYYKGFEAGDRTFATDLMDISIGVRFSFGN